MSNSYPVIIARLRESGTKCQHVSYKLERSANISHVVVFSILRDVSELNAIAEAH